MVVAGFVEACGNEVLGELASLGKAVDNFANFEIYPVIACFVEEVLFLKKSSIISERRTRTYS